MKSIFQNGIRASYLALAFISPISAIAKEPAAPKVLVGHICATSPTGMAMVINDRAGFVLEPQYSDRPQDDAQVAPGTTAPDGSYLKTHFTHQGAKVTLTWGALLNLIGVEALCGIDKNSNPFPFKTAASAKI